MIPLNAIPIIKVKEHSCMLCQHKGMELLSIEDIYNKFGKFFLCAYHIEVLKTEVALRNGALHAKEQTVDPFTGFG